MKLEASWTFGGDFIIMDTEEDAPVAELKLHEPLKSLAIDKPNQVAAAILKALIENPHPYADDDDG